MTGTLGAVRTASGRPYTAKDVTRLESLAERAALAIAESVATPRRIGHDDFEALFVHSVDGLIASLAEPTRAGLFRECHRVLRHGGRLVTIEAGARTGLAGLLRPGAKAGAAYQTAGGASAVIEGAGFKPVRLLADREGYRFTEGLKG